MADRRERHTPDLNRGVPLREITPDRIATWQAKRLRDGAGVDHTHGAAFGLRGRDRQGPTETVSASTAHRAYAVRRHPIRTGRYS
jgi:hypothetical protein